MIRENAAALCLDCSRIATGMRPVIGNVRGLATISERPARQYPCIVNALEMDA